MSFNLDPLVSHRIMFCQQCTKKPAQNPYIIKSIDRRVMFCSMKCLQCYKYLDAQKKITKDVKVKK